MHRLELAESAIKNIHRPLSPPPPLEVERTRGLPPLQGKDSICNKSNHSLGSYNEKHEIQIMYGLLFE